MKYLFNTFATMKTYNHKKWWIDSDIVREITTEADSLPAAIEQYAEIVKSNYYIDISKNALKCKQPMYIDSKTSKPKQAGYVITGKTDFQDDFGKWTEQYIDLWVNISIVSNPFEGATA